ncbi:hypothetical protein QZH41_015299 [Actinostola sp. cb2023]|nr:hypothetical protein QZH41_015299 [Actinostola sp. cb2023]
MTDVPSMRPLQTVHAKLTIVSCDPSLFPQNKKSIIVIDGSDEIRRRARSLHLDAQVPLGRCGKAELSKFQKALALLNVQLHVVYYEMGNMVGFRGERELFAGYVPRHVYLYFREDTRIGHKCTAECSHCKVPLSKCLPKMIGDEEWIECEACLVLFKNEDCFANHIERRLEVVKRRRRRGRRTRRRRRRGGEEDDEEDDKEDEEKEDEEDEEDEENVEDGEYEEDEEYEEDADEEEEEDEEDEEDEEEDDGEMYSVCRRYKRCPKCLKIVDLKIRKSKRKSVWREMQEHVCGECFCRCCATLVGEGHRCFIQQIPVPKKDSLTRPFVFLFFDFEAKPMDVRGHVVDLVKAMHVCNLCHSQAWTERCGKFGQRMLTFYSIREFMNFLIMPDNMGCIAVEHNARHYDGLFMLRWAIENGHVPKVIMNGGKLMSLIFPKLKFQVKDSLNFIPRPLRCLPKMFDLEETKGHFPHRFNTTANVNYIGPYPDAEFYGTDFKFMSEVDRTAFLERHTAKRSAHDPLKMETWFDLEREKDEYCEMDVMVLAKSMMKFREICIREDKIDPIVEVLTLPSFCMKTYRMNHMPLNSIGVLPEGGYRPVQNRVDGYDPTTNTVYEFHGCLFHGCPTCFPRRRMMNPISHGSMLTNPF